MGDTEIVDFFNVKHNVNSEIDIAIQVNGNIFDDMDWGKSLEKLPLFTIKEIELHRQNSGKSQGAPIIKTLDRGRKFKEERYISADSIFSASDDNYFYVKAICKASMKKSNRHVKVVLNKNTGIVVSATCSCPAGLSSYCNHVMAFGDG